MSELLFDDFISVVDLDPDGKKYDKGNEYVFILISIVLFTVINNCNGNEFVFLTVIYLLVMSATVAYLLYQMECGIVRLYDEMD